MTVCFKISDTESAMLKAMVASSEAGVESTGDFMRMLIHREWNRRKNLPKPEPWQWQGVNRTGGRPVKTKEQNE